MPLLLRPVAALAPRGILVLVVLLASCAEPQPLPADPTGRLFGRGLDQIAELYIVPVSSRKLALAAAARLSQLDPKFTVFETPGPQEKTELALDYGGRDVATYPIPSNDDPHLWGGWLGHLLADAKAASPTLATLSQDKIDETLFNGIIGALDRFSRYASPEAARDQRAARDGFGGIGVTFDPSPDRFRIIKVLPGGPADLAGIRAGDTIVAINGQPTAGRSQNDVIHLLRGPIVSSVVVGIDRPGIAQSHYYRLQRALIVEPTVTLSRDRDIAIFHISSFNQNTTQQLVEELDTVKREMSPRLIGVVLDLRGEPFRRLHQQGPDCGDRRPKPRESPILRGFGRQHRAADTDRRAGQWRFRLGFRNRCRGPSRRRTGGSRRYRLVRQRYGANRPAFTQQWRADSDLGPASRSCRLFTERTRSGPYLMHQ